MDRMVIIEGFPAIFNKFQVASLFPEFRPKNVLRAAGNQAIVEFENKFHAAQVIFSHCRGVKFPDEGFTLVARPHPFSQDPNACKEALRKKLLIIASQQDGQEKSKSCDVENDENAASKTK